VKEIGKMKKTVREWEKQCNTRVVSPDGFPKGVNLNKDLFMEEEFLTYSNTSTMELSKELVAGIGKLQGK